MYETLNRLVELNREVDSLVNIVKAENSVLQKEINQNLQEKFEMVFNQIEQLRYYMYAVGMENRDRVKLFTGIDGWRHVGNRSDNIYIQIYPDVPGFGVGCKGFGGNLSHETNITVRDLHIRTLDDNFTTKNLIMHWNDEVYQALQNELANRIAQFINEKSKRVADTNKVLKEILEQM